MESSVYPLFCMLFCGVFVWWRHAAADAVHTEGGAHSAELASSALLQPFSSPAVMSMRHSEQTEEDQGREDHLNKWHPQQAEAPAPSAECLPPASCTYSPSFVQERVNAETDVSCFPHDKNIGSRAATFEQRTTNTVKDCLARCRASSKCNHFTWNKNSRVCHLKSDIPEFYSYVGDMTGPRSCDTGCFLGCLTYGDKPVKTLNWGNNAPALCQASCWSTKSCRAFVVEDGKCKLFGSGFSATRQVSGGNSIAGPREVCEKGGDVRIVELSDGHSIGSCLKSDNIGSRSPELTSGRAQDVAECQRRCQTNNQCRHYTFSTRSSYCFLKSAKEPDYYPMSEDMTADKSCTPD